MRCRSRSISDWFSLLALAGYLLAGSIVAPLHSHGEGLIASPKPISHLEESAQRRPAWHERAAGSSPRQPIVPIDCLFCRLLIEQAPTEVRGPILTSAEDVPWTIAFAPAMASRAEICCHPSRGPPAQA